MILYEIKQRFKDDSLNDIGAAVRQELAKNHRLNELPKGSEVAVTAGSRGIENIALILKESVAYLKEKGYRPFLVPAMGSHGGATAEGQVEILRQLGITEESIGTEIRASMDTVKLGTTPDGLPVYLDKHAYGADGILVINRVKVHTAFDGKIASGLSKMLSIGLGKQKQASFVHSQGANEMEKNILSVSKYVLEHVPILMGLAIIENGYDKTAIIKGVSTENWHEEEAALLVKSKQMMPRLPLDELDILVIEEIGKNYSGTGMDPNIIGRMRIDGVSEPEKPDYKKILVLDLSEESHGNAQGIGLADFTTEKFVNKMDRKPTYMNAMTSTFLRRAMIPLYYPTEEEALEAAFASLGPGVNKEEVAYAQVPNTLHLDKLLVSKSALKKIDEEKVDYQVLKKVSLEFDDGELRYRLLNNGKGRG